MKSILGKLIQDFANDPIVISYTKGVEAQTFQTHFQGAKLVLFRQKKNKYATYDGDFSFESLKLFMGKVLDGTQKFSKLKENASFTESIRSEEL